MKTYLMLCLGALFFLFGCQEETVLPDDEMVQSDQSEICLRSYEAPEEYRHFIGNLWKKGKKKKTRKLIFFPSDGIFYVEPSDVCGDYGSSYQTVVEGNGVARPIGRYRVVNHVCIANPNDPVSAVGPWTGVITAANGDEIHTLLTGIEPDLENPPNATIFYDITGGTGRFLEASGYVDMYGSLDFAKGTWSLKGTGQITY